MLGDLAFSPADFAQFGIGGLLFVMWWFERRDRLSKEQSNTGAQVDKDRLYLGLAESVRMSDALLQVIERNTDSNVALRQEIKELRARGVCRWAIDPGCEKDGS